MGDWQHAEKVHQTYIEGGFLLFPPKKFLCTRITKVKELLSKRGKSKDIGTIPHCAGRNSSSTLTFSFFVFFRVGAFRAL